MKKNWNKDELTLKLCIEDKIEVTGKNFYKNTETGTSTGPVTTGAS
ncbi:hypothetical protein KX01_759 [Francisella frigiditurris]|uniref:Uncharacterized protein n=1 Tax=Francisella frigiditurris TaxID=1542390 RepID=A0A1J0KU12_9GAMM|nr:hypothetical protein KX01_759 [Francisella frigiditurris]